MLLARYGGLLKTDGSDEGVRVNDKEYGVGGVGR